MRIYTSRVGDKTDTFAFENVEIAVAKNFDTSFDFRRNLLIIIATCRKRAKTQKCDAEERKYDFFVHNCGNYYFFAKIVVFFEKRAN